MLSPFFSSPALRTHLCALQTACHGCWFELYRILGRTSGSLFSWTGCLDEEIAPKVLFCLLPCLETWTNSSSRSGVSGFQIPAFLEENSSSMSFRIFVLWLWAPLYLCSPLHTPHFLWVQRQTPAKEKVSKVLGDINIQGQVHFSGCRRVPAVMMLQVCECTHVCPNVHAVGSWFRVEGKGPLVRGKL